MATTELAPSNGEEEIDLNLKWAEACENFNKSFPGKKLNANKPTATPETVALQLRTRGEGRDSETQTKWSQLGKVVEKLGHALMQFSPVVVQIGSMFFGPSQLAMNAISFFVDAALAYHKIFEDLKKLFQKLADAMDRFADYHRGQDVLSNHVKIRANQILLKLVEICELGHKLLMDKSWMARAKRIGGSIFFGDDQGVSSQLEALERLSQVELQRNVIETMVNVKRVEMNFEHDKQFLWLKEKLSDENQDELWRINMMKAGTVPDAGSWIQDITAYRIWLDPTTSDQPILLLSGDTGSGKTVLVSTIVYRILGSMSRRSGTDLIALPAYYFFDRRQTVDAALRAMAMQLVRLDEVYRKGLHTNLRKQFDVDPLPSDVTELFKLLFGDIEISTLVLLFDDIVETVDVDALGRLLDFVLHQSSSFEHVKILVSGASDVIDSLQGTTGIRATIDVGSQNKDIEKMVRLEIDKMPHLQGSRPAVSELKQQIIEALEKVTNFYYAFQVLNDLRGLSRADDIRGVLKRMTFDPDDVKDMISREVDKLSDADVHDLNIILRWIICQDPLKTCDELELVLDLYNPEPSLKSLAERIQDEFRNLLSVRHDAVVLFASSAVEEYFNDNTAKEVQLKEDAEKLRNQGEVRLIVSQLKNLFGQEIYEKYGFASLLEAKAGRASRAYVDTDQMHAQMALDLMRLSAGTVQVIDSNFRMIRYLACNDWVTGLNDANVSNVAPDILSEIGSLLVTFFTDGVERWQPYLLRGDRFFCSSKITNMILRWMRRAEKSVKDLSNEQKKWLTELLDPTSDWKKILWASVIAYKARQWLILDPKIATPDDEEFPVLDKDDKMFVFRFIRGYIKHLDKASFTKEDYDSDEIPKEEIDAAARLSSEALGMPEFTAPALYRLAETYQNFGYYDEAVPLYEQATQKDPSFLPAIASYAEALFSKGDTEKAIQMIQDVIVTLEKGFTGSFSEPTSDIMTENIRTLSKWYKSTERYAEAQSYLQSRYAVARYPELFLMPLFDSLMSQNKHEECEKLLVEFFRSLEGLDRGSEMRVAVWVYMVGEMDTNELYGFLRRTSKLNLVKMMDKEVALFPIAFDTLLQERKDIFISIYKELMVLMRIVLDHFLLGWYQRYPTDENTLLAIATDAHQQLNEVTSSNVERFQATGYLPQLGERLCSYYLSKAATMTSDSLEERSLIEKAKELGRDGLASVRGGYVPLGSDDTNHMLGRYYSSRGDKENAMRCLRAKVRISLDLLSDEDPDNDWDGYTRLGHALVAYGDDLNAGMAFSLINRIVKAEPTDEPAEEVDPPPEDANSEATESDPETDVEDFEGEEGDAVSEVSTTEAAAAGPVSWECDGGCGHKWSHASDAYWCRSCPEGLAFNKECYNKLLAGDLFPAGCNYKHEFFYIPVWDSEKAADQEPGKVEIEGEAITIEEWKDRLRVAWGLPAKR